MTNLSQAAVPAAPAMFGESLVITGKPVTSKRKILLIWTSVSLHIFGGAALFAASLMTFESLERPPIKGVFNAPPPPPPPPPPPKRRSSPTPTTPVTPIVRPVTPTSIRVPTKVIETPKEVAQQELGPDEGVDDGVEGGVEGGVVGGVVGGVIGGVVGGVIDSVGTGDVILKEYDVAEPAQLIASSKVEPNYPETARNQGLEGNVFIELIIDENGRVVEARVTRSDNAVFNPNALNAVKQWRYTPARAGGGRAVRIYKTVTVKFKLH